MNIAYYISGHGFGHISRSYEIIKYFLDHKKDLRIFLRTTRGSFIKENRENLIVHPVQTDVGMYQKNSISLDIEKTLFELKELEHKKESICKQEIEFLKKENISYLISDSSSFPFVFSNELKIPSAFIGNFTWDFIYSAYSNEYPEFNFFIQTIANEYKLADKGLFLPFTCPMKNFTKYKNIGMIGRKPNLKKEEARKKYSFQKEAMYILFSFGAYGLEVPFQFENLPENYFIVVSGYEKLSHEKVINIPDAHYPDLLTACDAVLTKPGYGIVSEAIFASTPILYTERGIFAEYEYIVEEFKKMIPSYFLTQDEVFQMKLELGLKEIRKQAESFRNYEFKEGWEELFHEIFFQ
jgi:hypothetical protein